MGYQYAWQMASNAAADREDPLWRAAKTNDHRVCGKAHLGVNSVIRIN